MQFQQQLHWVSSPSEILTELTNSKENGNVIGITASAISPVMIMTAVEAILGNEFETIIQLKELDLLGMKIPHTQIPLSEIVKVHPLRTKYNDPRHGELRNLIK